MCVFLYREVLCTGLEPLYHPRINWIIIIITTRKQINRASLNIIRPIKTFKLYYYSPLNFDLNGRFGKQL